MFFTITSILLIVSIVISCGAVRSQKSDYGALGAFLFALVASIFFGWLWLMSVAFLIATWLGVAYIVASVVGFVVLEYSMRQKHHELSPQVEYIPPPPPPKKEPWSKEKSEEYLKKLL
jgi:predicted membrane protein